jgi:hypothetical protein
MERGLQIAWIAVALFGLAIVGWAFWFYSRAGSYLAIPELAGLVGAYIAFQGFTKTWRITRKTPPDDPT